MGTNKMTSTAYKLNGVNDVDSNGDDGFILNLPDGFRFDDEVAHVRGFDTMAQLKKAARHDVIICACEDCIKGLARGVKK